MKKKRNTTLTLKSFFINFLFTLLCLFGAALSILLFFKSFNQSLIKMNEKPIATITFKYKTAQRKLIDRVLWDRLKNESPVYNGDIIRTAPLSEATIWFTDGNIMNLYENTMAQVFLNDAGVQADLTEGNVLLDSENADYGFKLNSKGNILETEKGTKVNIEQAKDTELLKVLVQNGKALFSSLFSDNNQTQTIESGDVFVTEASNTNNTIIATQILSPLPNAKILYHDKKEYSVQFSWTKQNFTDEHQVLLEISNTKDFAKPFYSKTFTSKNFVDVSLSSGTWYYKIIPVLKNNSKNQNQNSQNNNQTLSGSEGKFTLMYAPSPSLLVPASDFEFDYRTKNPTIRFVWEDNQYASSWQLEIANNSKMQNPIIQQRTSSASSIINSLGKGTWYWRVTPYYAINNTGFASPSEVKKITINQSGQLKTPSLLLPKNNGNVDISSDSVSFSWKNINEAVSYNIIISKNSNLSAPIIKENIVGNHFELNKQNYSLQDGIYFWAVNQTDSEGNVSNNSEVRTFIAAKGELFQRTIFPPNNYKITEGRLEDINFTWKTNVPFETRFQVAKDSNFKNIIIDENTQASSTNLKSLSLGDYYWRIKADTNTIDYKSQTKMFSVIPYLDKPKYIKPVPSGSAIIRPNVPFKFEWQKVTDADYYNFKIYKIRQGKSALELQETLVYEKNLIEKTYIEVDLDNQLDGTYKWTVQAFAFETELSTRRNGLVGDYDFYLKHIHPVKLLSPENNKVIDGRDAIINPSNVTWSSVENPRNSTFYLSKNKNPTKDPIMVVQNPSRTIKLDRLQEGKYYWNISAFTSDGYDISSAETNTFTVTKISPLDNVTVSSPKHKTSFDVEYLKKNTSIKFSWSKVSKAEKYKFTLYDRKNNIIVETLTADTSFVIKDIGILDRGKFAWTVQAQNFFEGVLFQKSDVVKTEFEIDLPELKKQKVIIDGALYGK